MARDVAHFIEYIDRLAHMRCALNSEHGYLGASSCTMADTILSLEEGEE